MAATVLIVDDSATMRGIVSHALKEAGWAVATAANGTEALAVIDARSVALVVTDWNMPDMNGLALVQTLRARAEFTALPILILTTESDAASKQAARDAGASGWLNKPMDATTLVQIAASLLKAEHTRS